MKYAITFKNKLSNFTNILSFKNLNDYLRTQEEKYNAIVLDVRTL